MTKKRNSIVCAIMIAIPVILMVLYFLPIVSIKCDVHGGVILSPANALKQNNMFRFCDISFKLFAFTIGLTIFTLFKKVHNKPITIVAHILFVLFVVEAIATLAYALFACGCAL